MASQTLTNPSRYFKHPVAGSWLVDGDPIPANYLQIIDNNLSHLQSESYRHLVWDGQWSTYPNGKGASDGWADVTDNGQPVDTTGANVIAWSQGNSFSYGPFPGIIEQVGTNGDDFRFRKVRVDVRGYTDASATVYLYAAMTTASFGGGIDAGFPQNDRYLAFGTDSVGTGVGHFLRTITLTPSVMSRRTGNQVICRPNDTAARGSGFVIVPAFKLWLGFKFNSTSYIGSTYTVSMYEVPT